LNLSKTGLWWLWSLFVPQEYDPYIRRSRKERTFHKPKHVRKRRAKNRVASTSRKINRQAAKKRGRGSKGWSMKPSLGTGGTSHPHAEIIKATKRAKREAVQLAAG
jgi:hypothetical protein